MHGFAEMFSASYTGRDNGHKYGRHDPKTQLKVANNKAGNVHINAKLRCTGAKRLPWKISVTYSECVSVALFIQNVMRMLHMFNCGLSGSKIRFHIIS
jgi:hypothetical protein